MPAKLAKPRRARKAEFAVRRAAIRPAAADLLAWYERHARAASVARRPEGAALGVRPDPYRVWLSEVMLQQTTVKAVAPYFRRFVDALADGRAISPPPTSTTSWPPGRGSATTRARAI